MSDPRRGDGVDSISSRRRHGKRKKFENDFYGAGRVDRQPEFLYMKELSPASSLAHKSIVMVKVHA
jgi:hypothetical protein